jgi:hypothetical protein
MRKNQEDAAYVPKRKPKVGDIVAIYPHKNDDDLFFVGQVLEISPTKLKVHWWSAANIHGTYTPQFLAKAKKGKGHAGPYISGNLWKESVIDILNDFGPKKGKISKAQLAEILKLANQFKKT